jgi:hypothetical protein
LKNVHLFSLDLVFVELASKKEMFIDITKTFKRL